MEFSEFFIKMWFPINNVSINNIKIDINENSDTSFFK